MEDLYTFIKWKTQDWSRHFKNLNGKRIDYESWKPGLKLQLRWLIEWIGIEAVLAYFFYQSYWSMVILMPGLWFFRKEKIKKAQKKRKNLLEQQFKEVLLSVQTNMQSGYSLENAFLESRAYIAELYGHNSDMAQELKWIAKGLANKDTMENLLWDLGKRCPNSAVEDFAAVYSIAHKMGNGWGEIIVKIMESINQQIEIKQEIAIMIHGKKLESRIMCVVPFFILFYMNLTSRGYFNVLYHNSAGILIMSVCMAIYVFAFYLSEKITEL